MKTIIAIILIFANFAFAKESRSYTYAYVNHSEPVYEYRYDRVYEQCEDDYRHRSDYYEETRYENNNNAIGIDTLIGATLGVAIGNQIGKGNGRDVARVAGGILGATIANNTRDSRHNTHHKRYKKRHNYNSCDDGYYTQRKRKVLVGYKNYFDYDRKEYYKITKRPQSKIRITKTISF